MSWKTELKVEVMKNSLVKFKVEVLQAEFASKAWYDGMDKDEAEEDTPSRVDFGKRLISALEDELSENDLEGIVAAAKVRIDKLRGARRLWCERKFD